MYHFVAAPRADRKVVDDDVGVRLPEDLGDVVGVPRRLLDDLGDVLAEPVVGHAARDCHARLGHVGELVRVVRVRPDGVGEVLADLVLRDVEGGRELDVADVVAAEVDVHEARDEGLGIGVLVVLDALEKRVGAVADADDRDPDFLLGANAAVGLAVRAGHGFLSSVGLEGDLELVCQHLQDHVVDVSARAGGFGVDRVLEPLRHAQKRLSAPAGERAAPPRGGVREAEALGQDPGGEIVQVATAARDLANERALQGGRHPNEDASAVRSASSQTASTIARVR